MTKPLTPEERTGLLMAFIGLTFGVFLTFFIFLSIQVGKIEVVTSTESVVHVIEKVVTKYETIEDPLCRPEAKRDTEFAVRVFNDLPMCTLISEAEAFKYTYCRPVWNSKACAIVNGELPDDDSCY